MIRHNVNSHEEKHGILSQDNIFGAGKRPTSRVEVGWLFSDYLPRRPNDWWALTCSYEAVTEVIGYTIVWHVERRSLSLSLSLF